MESTFHFFHFSKLASISFIDPGNNKCRHLFLPFSISLKLSLSLSLLEQNVKRRMTKREREGKIFRLFMDHVLFLKNPSGNEAFQCLYQVIASSSSIVPLHLIPFSFLSSLSPDILTFFLLESLSFRVTIILITSRCERKRVEKERRNETVKYHP